MTFTLALCEPDNDLKGHQRINWVRLCSDHLTPACTIAIISKMHHLQALSFILSAILCAAQPTPAIDASDPSGDDINSRGTSLFLIFMFVLMILPILRGVIFYSQQYNSVKRMVTNVYSTLPSSERDKIVALQKEIEKVLDPDLPGPSKYREA